MTYKGLLRNYEIGMDLGGKKTSASLRWNPFIQKINKNNISKYCNLSVAELNVYNKCFKYFCMILFSKYEFT